MPPRKRARLSPSEIATPPHHPPSVAAETPNEGDTPTREKASRAVADLTDPWTDEQEFELFKAIIKWKPAGMHKHFRMISIQQQLRNTGFNGLDDGHTKIPGIWKKLGLLYNLEDIDERENSFAEESIDGEGDPTDEPFHEFTMPQEDYGEMMFDRRLAPEGSSSPPTIERSPSIAPRRGTLGSVRGSTVDDTDEESRLSPGSSRSQRGRGGRVKATPQSRLRTETRSSIGRKGSNAPSAVGEGEGSEEPEEEADEGDEDDVMAGDSPASRSTRHAPKTPRGVSNRAKPGAASRRGRRK